MPQEIMKSWRFETLLAFLASWRLILGLLRFAFDRNAGVGRHGANGLAAAAEVERQLAFDLSLQGDREIGLQSAVDSAGLEMGRIIFGNRQGHSAVGRSHVHSFAVPAIAGQVNRKTAVHRLAFHIPCKPAQRDAAVHRAEFYLTADVGNADAAVVRLERKIRIARGVDLETHRPAGMISGLRAFSVNISATCLYSDLTCQGLGYVVGVRPCLNLCAYQDFVSLPASHRHPTVLPAIDGNRPSRRGDPLLLNHTMRSAVAAPIVVAGKPPLFFTTILAPAALSERRAAGQT